jgi:polyhydroxybutyrate depolymerase
VLLTGCGGGDHVAKAVPSEAARATVEGDGSAGNDGETDDPSAADAPAVPSPGCGKGPAAPVVQERRTVEFEGAERWYLLTVPFEVRSPAPLVLDFHGLSEGAELHARTSGFDAVAQREGFVVAYPHGSGVLASWTVDPTGANSDARFVDGLLARLGEDLCLDTSRVYATGLSNGALLSSALGCSRATTFAAIAPVAGVAFPQECEPAAAVPMITFHGTADPILLFNGGVGQVLPELMSGKPITPTTVPPADLDGAGYPAAAAAWAEANGCGKPADEQVSGTIVHRRWDCPDDAGTEMWIVLGGGHTWPGSDALTGPISQIVGSTTEEIDASELSWEFLRRQRRDPG